MLLEVFTDIHHVKWKHEMKFDKGLLVTQGIKFKDVYITILSV